MSDKISILSDIVANQIAAGEVVICPASVVKEMMENSIDAGATKVVVNSRDGGSELIQIVDNGAGLSPNDARMAFEKHATSKISQVEDIYRLRSFGFRGEALASIGAVADVELKTRQCEDTVGTLTRIRGGAYISQEPVMCEEGANFLVRNLFYNLPARKRFLDKSTASTKQIRTEFSRVALCYPDVDFELYSNDALAMKLLPASLANRIVDVVGKHIRQNLLEVSVETSIVKVSGYIGKPSSAKRGRSEQYLFVNGRYFKSPYILKAVMRGYEKLIPANLNPSFFLYLDVEPDMIDVNVHPQKTEVKFVEKDAVWQIILAAVRETLAKGGGVPLMDFDREDDIDIPVINSQPSAPVRVPREVNNSGYNPFLISEQQDSEQPLQEDEFEDDIPIASGSIVRERDTRIASASGGTRLSSIPFDSLYEEFSSGVSSDYISIPSGGDDIDIDDESTFEFIESAESQLSQQVEMIPAKEVEVKALYTLKGGYVVATVDGELTIVDIRRLRERVLYDSMIVAASDVGYPSQRMLFAEELTLSTIEYELLEEYSTDFALLGFEFEYQGDGVISVVGLPAEVNPNSVDTLLYELLQICSLGEDVVEQTRIDMISSLSHRATLGAATTSLEQCASLLEEFFSGDPQRYTAKGKAIFYTIESDEIKKNLK